MPHEPEPAANAPHILIGVCTLNEAANIEAMLTGLRQAIPMADILVVDDQSNDGTGELVLGFANEDPAIRLVVREHERGLGSAIRKAMQVAVDEGYDYFMNLDGDLSHDPAQLPSLLEMAQSDPKIDVVIGSRYVTGGAIVGWPVHRKLMSRLVNRFATVCLGLPVKDCSGSMRCYRVGALVELNLETIKSQGYAVLEELLVKLHRQGAKMAEVPITFTDRQRGKSKLTLTEALRSTAQIISMARH